MGWLGPAHQSRAAYGLKFDVSTDGGVTWQSSTRVNLTTGGFVSFRFGVYFDGGHTLVGYFGPGLAGQSQALHRFTGSNTISGFASGDKIKSVTRTISSGNPQLVSVSGNIIGNSSLTSYGQQLFPVGGLPLTPQTYREVYRGVISVAGSQQPRTLVLENATFGVGIGTAYPTYGLYFYSLSSPIEGSSRPPVESEVRIDIPASITVSAACASDLNSDGYVDDTDFSSFVVAYNILDCADPEMGPNCTADLNGDGVVDDSDFTVFVVAYNALLCP